MRIAKIATLHSDPEAFKLSTVIQVHLSKIVADRKENENRCWIMKSTYLSRSTFLEIMIKCSIDDEKNGIGKQVATRPFSRSTTVFICQVRITSCSKNAYTSYGISPETDEENARDTQEPLLTERDYQTCAKQN